MKKILSSLVLLIASSLCTKAQDTTIVIGQRAEGGDIKMEAKYFSHDILSASVASDLSNACLFFRDMKRNKKDFKNEGKIVFYRTADRKIVYGKTFNYNYERAISTNKGLIISAGVNNEMRSIDDGHTLWTNSCYMFKVIDSLNMALSLGDEYTNKMIATNLNNGKEMWKTKFDHHFGCNYELPLSPGRQLMLADNLYDIDFATGFSRSCELKTGMTDVTKEILRGVAAVAGTALTWGMTAGECVLITIPTGRNVVSKLCSNICRHNSLYYVADHERILAVDTLMRPVWQTTIPDKMASASVVGIIDNSVAMLNMGYCMKDGQVVRKKGRPFIAAYDMNNGKELFLRKLYDEKHIIDDACAADDGFFTISDSIVSFLGVRDTTVAIQKSWQTSKFGKLKNFIIEPVYVNGTAAESFVPVCSNKSTCALLSDNGHVYVLDKHLNLISDYPSDEVFFYVTRGDGFRVIVNHLYSWIINDAGKSLAQVNRIRMAQAAGNSMFVLTNDNYVGLLKPVVK